MKKITTAFIPVIMVMGLIACNTFTQKTIRVSVDRHPTLTIENKTGLPIRISHPVQGAVNHGAATRYQIPSLDGNSSLVNVEYFIGDYSFRREVTVMNDSTVTLTERPPGLTVKNNTGYPISIVRPFQERLMPNETSKPYYKTNRETARYTVTYTTSHFSYSKAATLDNDDVTVTVTESAPLVTISNNTGSTINIVHIRNSGSTDWGDANLIALRLDEHGVLAATSGVETTGVERRGSFLNNESFRIWFGNVRNIKQEPDRYDIRIDDVHSIPYVKYNVQIISDMTITFSQTERVR